MRTVSSGSPVDARWSVLGMMLSQLRHERGNAPADSPLTLQDVVASDEYRNLMTAKVAVGDHAPDFELPCLDGAGSVRLGELLAECPAALIFGSYTLTPVPRPGWDARAAGRTLRRSRPLPGRLHPRGTPRGRLEDPPRESPLGCRRARADDRRRTARGRLALRCQPRDAHARRRRRCRQRGRVRVPGLARPALPRRLRGARRLPGRRGAVRIRAEGARASDRRYRPS
jgi:hypothetical protein